MEWIFEDQIKMFSQANLCNGPDNQLTLDHELVGIGLPLKGIGILNSFPATAMISFPENSKPIFGATENRQQFMN